MEKPDLIVAGFPCQGFSRASGQACGLADPRTHLLTEALRVIHLTHRRRGHCGWLIENVDATDHPIDSVRRDFNEVVKRLLGEGVVYDAISVGSYAHRYRRYWPNLIPGPLLHEMVEKRFLMRFVDQQVQDVLEPGRFAQTCQHNRSPGPHTVNIPGRPCRALRGYCRSSSGPAERPLHHGWGSPKFRLPDLCPLACPSHAICLLAMRNERARRRRLNWPIYSVKWC
jgi:hypothetical protein